MFPPATASGLRAESRGWRASANGPRAVPPPATSGAPRQPPRAQRVLGGRVPPAAAGLEPDAWLVARLAAHDAVWAGGLPVDELRARFDASVATVSIRPRLPVATEDRTVAGAAGPLGARLYVPAG